MKIAKYVLLFLCLALLCGCSSREVMPGVDVPLSQMNKAFTLIPNPNGDAQLKNSEIISFELRNLSEKIIIFPGDFGLKLFIKKGNEWVIFENNLLQYPDKEISLPTRNQSLLGRHFGILPSILKMDNSVILRVVCSGYYENQPDQKVYGYADIKLEP